MRVFVEIALWVIVLSEINDDDNASKGNINKKTTRLILYAGGYNRHRESLINYDCESVTPVKTYRVRQ